MRNFLLIMLLLFIALFSLQTYRLYSIKETFIDKCDTIYKTRIDTLKIAQPIYIKQKEIRRDTIKINIEKQVVKQVNDTVFIDLPIEQKVYSDSSYTAWVSGYNPNLDSINIFQKEKTILINKNIINNKKKRFSIGPSFSVGYDIKHNNLSPTVGLSIQYNLISF